MNKIVHAPQKENGQSLVELSVSLLFLLILVAGVVDLGRAFFTYMALRDAAQEGAAYASIAREHQTEDMKCAEIVNRAQNTSNTQIVNLADTSVDIYLGGVPCVGATNTNACFGNSIEVQVSYANFQLATPFLGTILGSQSIDISASILDSVLTPPCH